MKKLNYLFLFLLVPALLLTSCKEEADETTPESKSTHKILTEYLVANNMDLPAILDGWIVGAPAEADVATFIETYNIIDIRGGDDFTAGHIEGAKTATLATVLDVAKEFEADKPVLVVCYTGQTAGHAVVALRLSGETDAKVLKFGMCGWTSQLASNAWESNAKQYEDLSNWSATKNLATNQTFGEPTISYDSEDGAAILTYQVEQMLAGGLAGVSQADVLGAPANYFINNYWAESDVDHYGHITGAYRINPLTIADGEIYNLDPGADVVTYCWTGQTSSMITAYLKVLGYKSWSLKFGTNGMIYDNLESHKYSVPTLDLPVVQ